MWISGAVSSRPASMSATDGIRVLAQAGRQDTSGRAGTYHNVVVHADPRSRVDQSIILCPRQIQRSSTSGEFFMVVLSLGLAMADLWLGRRLAPRLGTWGGR